MNIALWIIQGILAAMFLFAGGMKLFSYEKFKKSSDLSRSMTTFIGLSEIAGGAGLILPMLTGVAPILTPIAAAALAVVMLLAAGFHLRRKEPVAIPAVLLVLCCVVAIGRF